MVRRIYVEKKEAFGVQSKELAREIVSYLGIRSVTKTRVLIRYDVESVGDEVFEKACRTVFSEPPVDTLYEGSFPHEDSDRIFSIEALPGQFDQRADSAMQCIGFIDENTEPIIRTAVTYCLSGDISESELEAIKGHVINPVDSGFSDDSTVPETLKVEYDEPADVKIFDGFISMDEAQLKELYDSLSLAMTFKDFLHIKKYFTEEEKRDPSMTEIRVLDTYWSDHCRHTTFSTELKNISFDDGFYKKPIEDTYKEYLKVRDEVFGDRVMEKGGDKFVCLMDLALMAMRKLKKDGKLNDQEETDEINACSVVIPVEIKRPDGTSFTEEWLLSFKNETHNHPTEIEPFGGAATCLGGAIRDPLSGRAYVYQAMRVTGAADPTRPSSETMKGKLSQKRLVRTAAQGYSSYGNQIGLATGLVKEIYHPNYVAKRMEIGAVMGAAPRKNVVRETSDPGDVIILLGGRTGRDGCGGATGSSKAHTDTSLTTCGAEVQKGNAPTERKIQRLFRRPEVSRLIKKCNDFGAGGVSVAIGELAAGLEVDLDLVPKKYAGLDGTELAISESQERMAVVVSPDDAQKFLDYSAQENLEAVKVAVVTKEPRLVLKWRGRDIVNISRAFLDTNGAHQETDVKVDMPVESDGYFDKKKSDVNVKEAWIKVLSDLNGCSQRGLVERFDASIGAGSVFMPYGGKYQMTPTQTMVAKLPSLEGTTDAVSMMSYGFDPYLSDWSPYHGAVYAVTQSIAKIVASGGDYKKIRFTFQEYFRRMWDDPERWSQPFAALLGAFAAQLGYGLPSIGGKDSMSGTFNDIDVPPTLVSFAVDHGTTKDVITPELKKTDSLLALFTIPVDEYRLPVYEEVMKVYDKVAELIKEGAVISAYAVEGEGLVSALSQMAFGNRVGFEIDPAAVSADDLFLPGLGCIVAEVAKGSEGKLEKAQLIGRTRDDKKLVYGDVSLSVDEAQAAYDATLEKVFPTRTNDDKDPVDSPLYDAKGQIYVCKHKVAKPHVFIPVFPGTNCEFDSRAAFERAGATVTDCVFRNLSASDIRESMDAFVKEIDKAQIIMFPGGFSAGDEPDGSAKFFATAFQNDRIREAVERLLNERDGLALGICNGFQALIKLGLVPNGKVTGQTEKSPTLTYNTIGRHISRMVYTKVVTNKSPWLAKCSLGGVYTNPASHGEGRFVADKKVIDELFANGQVATQYCDVDGNVTMDELWNVNGSYAAIEGITSPDGRCLGKMAHSERRADGVAINIYGEQDMKIFESGVAYFG